jgi:hypothetical protein
MCNTCRQNQIQASFKPSLHSSSDEIYPEMEWSSLAAAAKDYASPFFNWLGGYSSAPLSNYTKPSTKYSKPSSGYQQPLPELDVVKKAIANGNKNENSLTDILFFKRHTELGGKPLYSSQPNFSSLSSEWISIRNKIVRPALQAPARPPVITNPAAGGSAGKINLQSILNALAKKRYIIYTKPYQLNIVGVRANIATPDSFDDSINVFYKDNGGNWQFKSNKATTDPGLKVLMNPDEFNSRGTGSAILIPAQYAGAYQIGLHRGSYTALVQTGGPVRVMRDFNKDNKLDFRSGREDPPGYYGINIHRAISSGTSATVDDWSAGCQVFANSADFAAFISLCRQHSNLYGNSFTYTLMEEGDL